MTLNSPGAACYELTFQGAYPVAEAGEVALEDYARALTRSQAAEAIRAADDPALVKGVHVCGVGNTVTRAVLTDLEDFARSLIVDPGGGLGWS
jgi:hypothetical protein